MKIKCSKNETVLKSWDYAHTKQGSEKKDYNLTVTDKRIIASEDGNRGVKRSEIYLEDVKSIECGCARNGSILWALAIILGLITAIFIVGIALIVIAVKRLREYSFALTITTKGNQSDGIALGKSSFAKARKSHGRLKVTVDRKQAEEIISELGAIILDAKAQA